MDNARLVSFPEISFADATSPGATSREGARIFNENGALLIRGLFPPDLVEAANARFAEARDQQLSDIGSGRALRVGARRYMLSVEAGDAIGSPEFLAERKLMAIMDEIFGDAFILGSLSVVLSLSKSKAQHWHRDNTFLFPEREDLIASLPCYSLAAIVPMIPVTSEIGATEVIPKSHLNYSATPDIDGVARPEIALGDCYLMDSRILHRGMPNTSAVHRPIASLVYQRPWYRDFQNFENQATLRMTPETVATFPEDRRTIVDWALRS